MNQTRAERGLGRRKVSQPQTRDARCPMLTPSQGMRLLLSKEDKVRCKEAKMLWL
jgi:hypothetical protein